MVAAVAVVAGVAWFAAVRPDGGGTADGSPPAATVAPATTGGRVGGDLPGRAPGTGSPVPTTRAGPPDPVPATSTGPPLPPQDTDGVATVERLDPAAAAAAVRAAEAFAVAWSTPGGDWHERLAGYTTGTLAAALAGATPVDPAPERVGAGTLRHGTPAWARVRVPTDRGDLVLDLTMVGSRWLVSAVDWRPA